jgi:hypothetical protein
MQLLLTRRQKQSLVFGSLLVSFSYFRFILVEKTKSPSSRLLLARERKRQLLDKNIASCLGEIGKL